MNRVYKSTMPIVAALMMTTATSQFSYADDTFVDKRPLLDNTFHSNNLANNLANNPANYVGGKPSKDDDDSDKAKKDKKDKKKGLPL